MNDPSTNRVKGWIVNPGFDLLFFSNIYWPLFLVPGFALSEGTVFDFWQVYFLTLPHRWITLVLVAIDPDRREGIGPWLVGAAVIPALIVLGFSWGFGDFRCLALVDFVWNAWHFGSQHQGLLRLQDRLIDRPTSAWERWGVRWFVVYTLLRLAEWSTDWIPTESPIRRIVIALDGLTLGMIGLVIATNILPGRLPSVPKWIYLGSVCGIYGGLLGSLMLRDYAMTRCLATATAMFHAVEYLAIVSHYAARRQQTGSPGAFRELGARWIAFLPLFLLVLSSLGQWLERPEHPYHTFWIGLNLWMALVHYGMDGMIWKLRKPATARALGLERSA